MALFNLTELAARLARGQRLLGIDPGRKRVGLALSDAECRLATPHSTLARGKLAVAAAAIGAIARAEAVGGLVIGLPLQPDGGFGPAAQAARDWALALTEATGLPGAMQDERMSSVAAAGFLADHTALSAAKRRAVTDRLAAAIILQSALDRLAAGRGEA
ncbi:MAG: Holliday junction resolvase RuvX [Acetobacteraceae bacterium]